MTIPDIQRALSARAITPLQARILLASTSWEMSADQYCELMESLTYRNQPFVDVPPIEIDSRRTCVSCGEPHGDHFHSRCHRCRRPRKVA